MSEAPAAWARQPSKKRSVAKGGSAKAPGAAVNGNGHAQHTDKPAAPAARFRLMPFDEIKVARGRSYLVKGLIPREGVIVVWGPPKCGKTFWTFDVVMHIAASWKEYRGRRVEPGSVVYVACEGERGLAARVEAFRRGKMIEGDSGARFSLISTRLDLVTDCAVLIGDIRAQLPDGECSVIVIDTLNRSIRGSESDDAVMGDYVRAADALREAFGCAVIIIHHCGVDISRPRGHTSLTGAADAQIAVKRDKAGHIETTVEWMKDGPEGAKTLSTLEQIDVGEDEDKEPITSCYIVPCDEDREDSPANQRKRPKISKPATVALALLKKALDEAGEPAPASRTIPSNARVVGVDLWSKFATAGGVEEKITKSTNAETQRKAFYRARMDLQAAEIVGVWQGYAWLKEP